MSQTTCDKCAVGSATSTGGYYVILCPLHQAALELLEAAKEANEQLAISQMRLSPEEYRNVTQTLIRVRQAIATAEGWT